MIKIIANNPSEQDLADYLEAISEPYVKLVTQSHFDSMVDGRVRAIKTEVIDNELVHTVIFPEEEVPPEFEKIFTDKFNDILT